MYSQVTTPQNYRLVILGRALNVVFSTLLRAPLGSLLHSPDTLAGFKRAYSLLLREEEGRGWEGKGK